MKVLITGSSGFIGYHLAKSMLQRGIQIVGLDNHNSYYDPALKEERLNRLKAVAERTGVSFHPIKGDLIDSSLLKEVFRLYQPEVVVNLAAQAGVRYSLSNPSAYIRSNIVGFSNLIEESKENKVKHFVYASSSSVYGGNEKLPFSETHSTDHPVSLYAATKKSNELIAHSYSHLYGLATTGLRFFTVYGPWGRPDMALFIFTKAILEGGELPVFNNGLMSRDFTYIDDVVSAISLIVEKIPHGDKHFRRSNPANGVSWAPYKIFNIGNSQPATLMRYIKAIEDGLGMKAKLKLLPSQPGDVSSTFADVSRLEEWVGYKPNTSVEVGVAKFVRWYLKYNSL